MIAKFLNSKRNLFIIAIPIAFVLLSGLAYQGLSREIEAALLHEKFVEKQQSVELMAAQIDAYTQTPAFQNGYGRFELILSAGLALVDAQPYTYAALYDEQLDNVSARTPSYSSGYEPLEDTAFKDTVTHSEDGTYVMPYTPEGGETRDMHIYYRWIPTDTTFTGRYLAIVAVSRYSIESIMPARVWTFPGTLLAVTFVLVTLSVWLLCYLGDIYEKRKGKDKHRRGQHEV